MGEGAELIAIAGGGLSAEISAQGAELVRLRDREGRDLLWDGDPAFWTGRAPLLFPIVGALVDGQYRLDGRSYSMPKHGFARGKRFTVAEAAESAALFRLEADEETLAAYPFRFRLDVRFTLDAGGLTMTAMVENRSDVPMPASFGFHPALRWPLPYGEPRAAHRLRFEREERAPIRRVAEQGLIDPAPKASPVEGDTLRLEDSLFVNDAVIFDRLESRKLVYGAEHGPSIEVEFSDLPHLGIWTKPGAGYICIEPWQGYADPAEFAGELRDKPGIVEVAPSETRAFVMRMRLID